MIGAVRDSEKCHPELICDGVHIHPSVIRATFAMFGADRMILISDSMRATGLEDGEYTLGGQPVTVRGNLATLHDGTIAESDGLYAFCSKNSRSAVRDGSDVCHGESGEGDRHFQ